MTDYATETPTVNVHVKSSDVPLANNDRPKECRTANRTFVLTATNPYMNIAAFDPYRTELHIEAVDNAVVLCNSISQASDPNNMISTLLNPNGRVLSTNVGEYVIPGPDETWLAAATYPSRVGVTIVREI